MSEGGKDWFEQAVEDDESDDSGTAADDEDDETENPDAAADDEREDASSEDGPDIGAEPTSQGQADDGGATEAGADGTDQTVDWADGPNGDDDGDDVGRTDAVESGPFDRSVEEGEPSDDDPDAAGATRTDSGDEDGAEGDATDPGAVESFDGDDKTESRDPEFTADPDDGGDDDTPSVFGGDDSDVAEFAGGNPDDAFAALTDEAGAGGSSGGMVDPDGNLTGEGGLDDDEGALFEDDFASALGDADVPGGSGMTGGPDPNDEAFSMGTDSGGLGDAGFEAFDEEVDSEIPRIELGIEGLDQMIQGGIPERSLMVAIGSAGTGKTTFGLQFLAHGLDQGERAVFITLEETSERVIRSATEKGYAFDEYHESGQLAVVDIDPVEMANSLRTIGSELPRLIEEFDASRLVLDSVSLLEMMYDERAARRNEIYQFTKQLKQAGVTTMMTSEASDENAYVSRHGIVEYLTDAVFVLQYVRPSDFRETRLAVEIQKIRDANHSRETKPYDITDEGIEVHRRANIF